jgi:hypothetical protein
MPAWHLPDLHTETRPALRGLAHAFWVLSGVAVLLYIFLAALGAIDPSEAVVVTAVIVVLALLWLAHEWGQLWRDERRS